MHENEKNWTKKGMCVSSAPPPPDPIKKSLSMLELYQVLATRVVKLMFSILWGGGPCPSPIPVQNPTSVQRPDPSTPIQVPSATRHSQLGPHYAGTQSDMFKLVS